MPVKRKKAYLYSFLELPATSNDHALLRSGRPQQNGGHGHRMACGEHHFFGPEMIFATTNFTIVSYAISPGIAFPILSSSW
jgi:hypothetical protein